MLKNVTGVGGRGSGRHIECLLGGENYWKGRMGQRDSACIGMLLELLTIDARPYTCQGEGWGGALLAVRMCIVYGGLVGDRGVVWQVV